MLAAVTMFVDVRRSETYAADVVVLSEWKSVAAAQNFSVTTIAILTTSVTLPSTPANGHKNSNSFEIWLGAGISGGLVLFLLFMCALICCIKSRRRRQLRRELMRDYSCEHTDVDVQDGDYVPYSETNSFDTLIAAYDMKMPDDYEREGFSSPSGFRNVARDGEEGSSYERGGQSVAVLLASGSESLRSVPV